MSWRWIRRLLWVVLIVALAIVPARVAQSPESAQAAAAAGEAARAKSPSSAGIVTWIVLGTTLAAVPLLMKLRRRIG